MTKFIFDDAINNAIVNMFFVNFLRQNINCKILRGIPVKTSENFILIKRINGDCLWDGYSLIRKRDITECTVNNSDDSFIRKLQIKQNLYIGDRIYPIIDSFESFFNDINKLLDNENIVTLYRKYKKEKWAFVGRIKEVTHASATLTPISPIAKWEEDETLYFSSYGFSRIDYGDRYTKMLLRMQEKK